MGKILGIFIGPVAPYLLAAALGLAGLQWWGKTSALEKLKTAIAELTQVRAENVSDRQAWAAATLRAQQDQAAREQAIRRKADQEVQDAQAQTRRAAADLAAAFTQSGQLREQALIAGRALAARSGGGCEAATPAAGSSAGAATGVVPAWLYDRTEAEALGLGAALDAARAAGQRCERLYEAVRTQ